MKPTNEWNLIIKTHSSRKTKTPTEPHPTPPHPTPKTCPTRIAEQAVRVRPVFFFSAEHPSPVTASRMRDDMWIDSPWILVTVFYVLVRPRGTPLLFSALPRVYGHPTEYVFTYVYPVPCTFFDLYLFLFCFVLFIFSSIKRFSTSST